MFPAFLVFLLAFGLIVLGASACRAFELHRDDILYGGESEVSETIPTGRQPPSIDDNPVLEEVDVEPHQTSVEPLTLTVDSSSKDYPSAEVEYTQPAILRSNRPGIRQVAVAPRHKAEATLAALISKRQKSSSRRSRAQQPTSNRRTDEDAYLDALQTHLEQNLYPEEFTS